MQLKNPEAPATNKQLWKLHQLTGEDTTGLKISMQEASDRIAELELEREDYAEVEHVITSGRQPFNEAKVTIVEGEQGGGKSNTATAMVRDSYDKDCVAIYCHDVLNIRCRVIGYDRKTRIATIRHDGRKKLIRIPKEYKLKSPMRIFCNFHLYGIPFVYCPSFKQILAWLKKGVIRDGWLVVDEYYIGGNARAGMTALGRELSQQSFQFRKMQLQVIVLTPMARLIDWTMRTIPTEHINCSYNKKTRKITLTIRKKGQVGSREVVYDATQYWPNYWTNERINA